MMEMTREASEFLSMEWNSEGMIEDDSDDDENGLMW